MNQLRVYLLGKFVACYKDETPIRFTSHKEEELFCYLVLKRGRSHSREAVASLLWGDTTTAQSKKYLRTALWHLRSDLGCTAGNGADPFITTTIGWIQLGPDANIWTDVNTLEYASTLVRGIAGENLSAQEVQHLQEALNLYKGKLLEGWYQDWCLYERERLQHLYFEITDKLMAYYEAHDRFDEGIALGLNLLGEEPAHESTHRRLMRLYYQAGRRCEALRQFHRCKETLYEELDAGPSSLTTALYEQIRTDGVAGATNDALLPASHDGAQPSALRKVLGCLAQLQTLLGSAQQQLQREIDDLEIATDGNAEEQLVDEKA